MSIKDFLISFWQLTSKVFFAKRAKVMFYYPQHFNRTAQGTNPFFDRMLETCDKNGIYYQLIEEPDWGTDKPRNPKAIKGDALFVLITIVRKIVTNCVGRDLMRREKIAAGIVNVLTFGRFRREKYITISGSMLNMFVYMNKRATVYDMQHGILYKQHPTFFDEQERLRPYIAAEPRWHWLMWGKGYEECFCRGDEAMLIGRTHVVGYPIVSGAGIGQNFEGKNVLFSLQFTHDFTEEELERQKVKCEETLRQLNGKGVKVLLKHHPRFNNAINIDDWNERFLFCEFTKKSMAELLPEVMLQITLNSTTSFEYAEYGIPSFFFDADNELGQRGDLFYREYRYPLYKDASLGEVVERLQDGGLRKQYAEVLRRWYREFYDEFNEEEFLRVIEE